MIDENGTNGQTVGFEVSEDHFLEIEDCEDEEDVRNFLITYGSDIWNQAIAAAADRAVKIHPRWGPSASTEIMKLSG